MKADLIVNVFWVRDRAEWKDYNSQECGRSKFKKNIVTEIF